MAEIMFQNIATNLRGIQLFVWQGCRVLLVQAFLRFQPVLFMCLWSAMDQPDVSPDLVWVCSHVWGKQLAEGWPRVVFAAIIWVTQLYCICLPSSVRLMQTCPHSDGQEQEHEWNMQEVFKLLLEITNIHWPKQVTWLQYPGVGK